MPRWSALAGLLPGPVAGSTIRARMARGVAWTTLGTASNQGSTVVVNILVAHIVARDSFGQYALIQTTLAVLTALAQVATGYTATKYLAEYRERDAARAGRILGLCWAVALTMASLATIALLLGAGRLSSVLADSDLAISLRITAAIVFFNVMNGFLSGALAGLENYRPLGKIGIIGGALYVGMCTVGALWGGLNGALAGAAASAAIQCAFLWKLVVDGARRAGIVVNARGVSHEREVLVRFSIPAALTGLVSLPALWMASAFLARQPGGYDQLALFSAANSFRILVLFLPNILNTVGMSLLNNQLGAGEENQFRRLFWQNLAGMGAMACVSAAAIALAGPWLLLAFGSHFTAAYPVLLILMIAALAEGFAIAVFQAIQTRGRLWISLLGVALPASLTLIVLAAWLTPRAGAIGLAWAYVGWWSVTLACECLIVRRTGIWRAPESSCLVRA